MESTGVYWIPLFGVLEERGFEVMLVETGEGSLLPLRQARYWSTSSNPFHGRH